MEKLFFKVGVKKLHFLITLMFAIFYVVIDILLCFKVLVWFGFGVGG